MYILDEEQKEMEIFDLELSIKYFSDKARFRKKVANAFRDNFPELAKKYDHQSDIATRSKNRLQIQHDRIKNAE
jgi:hypothetical protein